MVDINYANLKIFARLVKCGFTTEKQITDMGIGDLTRIPKVTAAEIRGIHKLQQAIKKGEGLSFFVEDIKSQSATTEEEETENHEV